MKTALVIKQYDAIKRQNDVSCDHVTSISVDARRTFALMQFCNIKPVIQVISTLTDARMGHDVPELRVFFSVFVCVCA